MPATVATAEVSIGTNGQQNGSVHSCANGSSSVLKPRTLGKPSTAAKRSSSTAAAMPKGQISYMHSSSVYPALLVFLCPFFVMLFSYTVVKLDGSPTALLQEIRQKGIASIMYSAWAPYIFGSTKAWKFILPYAMFQLALMKILPGKLTKGPITPAGNVPIYRANGMLAYLVTLVTYFICAYVLKLFNPADIYNHYLEFIGAMNVLSLIFCLGIYLKGRFIPSTTDCGASGNFIFDYYWGTELYPRILDWDIKMFTNCRFGMMGWPLLILSYAAKQHETHGLSDSMIVAVALQLIYITKFFHWEMGYMKSLDIMHDRAGFYLCWGCFVWLPSIYTSHTLYLTNHPNNLGLPLSVIIFTIGALSIYLNYSADTRRKERRKTACCWYQDGGECLGTFTTSPSSLQHSAGPYRLSFSAPPLTFTLSFSSCCSLTEPSVMTKGVLRSMASSGTSTAARCRVKFFHLYFSEILVENGKYRACLLDLVSY